MSTKRGFMWVMAVIFGILAGILVLLCIGARVMLKKATEKYYCAG